MSPNKPLTHNKFPLGKTPNILRRLGIHIYDHFTFGAANSKLDIETSYPQIPGQV